MCLYMQLQRSSGGLGKLVYLECAMPSDIVASSYLVYLLAQVVNCSIFEVNIGQ